MLSHGSALEINHLTAVTGSSSPGASDTGAFTAAPGEAELGGETPELKYFHEDAAQPLLLPQQCVQSRATLLETRCSKQPFSSAGAV